MQRKLCLIVAALLIAFTVSAQEMQDIFNRKANITWLGLDFSGAKFIGDRERFGSHSDVHLLMGAWNDLLLKEADKFDIGLAIDKIKVEEDFSITKSHNAELDPGDFFSNSEGDYLHLRPNDILRIVAGYDFKGKTGLGVMVIVESFNKLKKEGSVWITFVDMGRKDVFFAERVTGEPGGAGLRNYWANAIHDAFKRTQKKEFEMWRKKYYRKS
jgi:hypothetical protein